MRSLPQNALLFFLVMLSFYPQFMIGEVQGNEIALDPDLVKFEVELDGLVARTRITSTYINSNYEDTKVIFGINPGPERYIISLEVNGQEMYLVENDISNDGAKEVIDRNGNASGWESGFSIDTILKAMESLSISVILEERMEMWNGSFRYQFPLDSVLGYEDFGTVIVDITDSGTHHILGRDIHPGEDSIPLEFMNDVSNEWQYAQQYHDQSSGDALEMIISLEENENWYQTYIQRGDGVGHYMISCTPWREKNGTSHLESTGSIIDIHGEVLEDLNGIEYGGSGSITGVFADKGDSIGFDLDFMTDEGKLQVVILEDDPDLHFQDWVRRYWELAWMDHLLHDAFNEGGGNGTMDDVVSFSIERSILSPYTSFMISSDRGNFYPGTSDDEERWDDPDELNSGENDDGISKVSYNGWPEWGEYYRDAPPDDDQITLEGSDDPFMEKYWPIILVSVIALILIVSGGAIYSRLKEDDLLKQAKRKMIYDHIMAHPGDHFRAIQRAVGLEVGTLSHHMNILEREQLIISEQDGNNRCFWVAGVKRDTGKVRLSRIQENILKEIQTEPGITQVQIAKKLGVSRKVVFYHVKFLASSDMVMEEKIKRRAHYYPAD